MAIKVERSIEMLQENMKRCIINLGSHLNMPIATEANKIEMVSALYTKLKPRNAGKKVRPVLTAVEASITLPFPFL